MINIQSETTIAISSNLDLMKKLRSDICSNFDGVWVYLYNHNASKFTITVATVWSGKISSDVTKKLKKFVNAFVKKNSKKYKDLPDEVSAFLNGVDTE